GMRHLGGAFQHLFDVDADDRAGHHPEVGERRITPADVRRIGKNPPELMLAGELFERASRIGDGSEMKAGILLLDLRYLVPEVSKMRQGLGRLAGLAGDE